MDYRDFPSGNGGVHFPANKPEDAAGIKGQPWLTQRPVNFLANVALPFHNVNSINARLA